MKMSTIGKRWLLYALIAVLAVVAILTFVLPWVGGPDSGITKIHP
jgi:hypothetical protein